MISGHYSGWTLGLKHGFGVPGAVTTGVIALVTLWFQLKDPVYRVGVYAVAAWYLLGLLYFALFGRHHLILSPEEEFALSTGARAHALDDAIAPGGEKVHT